MKVLFNKRITFALSRFSHDMIVSHNETSLKLFYLKNVIKDWNHFYWYVLKRFPFFLCIYYTQEINNGNGIDAGKNFKDKKLTNNDGIGLKETTPATKRELESK